MPDCTGCGRPLGGQLRRDRKTGMCEDCYDGAPEGFEPFTPAELGLDPEHYDVEKWMGDPPRMAGTPRRRRRRL